MGGVRVVLMVTLLGRKGAIQGGTITYETGMGGVRVVLMVTLLGRRGAIPGRYYCQ